MKTDTLALMEVESLFYEKSLKPTAGESSLKQGFLSLHNPMFIISLYL